MAVSEILGRMTAAERSTILRSLHSGELGSRRVGEAAQQVVELADFLAWLASAASERKFRPLLRSLLAALAFEVDAGPWWTEMSQNALEDAPVPLAVSRTRRIDPLLRQQLGHEAGRATLARTGAKAVQLMHRIRHWKVRRISDTAGSSAVAARAALYKQSCRATFGSDSCKHLSIAMDASRVGKRDTLYLALYSPELDQAMWLPPQVKNKNEPKKKAQKIARNNQEGNNNSRRKSQILAHSCRFVPCPAVSCRFLPVESAFFCNFISPFWVRFSSGLPRLTAERLGLLGGEDC